MAAVPSLDEARAARAMLSAHLPHSRLVDAPSLTRRLHQPVRLDLECELPTGSFKPRGALYALATRTARGGVREVVASSTGNHGAAVAWAARTLGVPATIVLPQHPNPVKRARIAELGARIIESGPDLAAAFRTASAYAEENAAFLLNDATDPDLPAGTATIALEIFEQAPETRVIFVPIGDTALIRGVAAAARALQPDVRLVGVQAARAPSYFLSWQQGEPVSTATCDTIADGLATRTPDAENVRAIRQLVDEIVLVEEEQLLDAVRYLILEEHVVAEPAGAAATAAALRYPRLPGPAVLLVTGANVAAEVLRDACCR